MLERRPGPNVYMDRFITELSSSKPEYDDLLGKLESIALQVIAENDIPISTVSIQTAMDEDRVFTDRALKAMHAYVSIRLLKGWENDAIREGKASAETFYHIAHHAITACLTATLVSPMVSDFEAEELKALLWRQKGGDAAQAPFKLKDEAIKAALGELWTRGARYPTLGAWSKAIGTSYPELAPPKEKSNAALNKRVSKLGKELFGEDWPI